jgi:chromosome segregation ATPase
MAITKQDIFAVADRLNAEGRAPTLAAVRKALGSGSFTTISEAMRDWREKQKQQAERVEASGPVPPDLDEALRRFAQEVWVKASELADAQWKKLEAQFAEARTEWELERGELEAVAEDLSAALEEAEERARSATEEMAALGTRLAVLETKASSLEAQLLEKTARIEELRQENDRLHALLDRAIKKQENDHGSDEHP